VAGEDARHAHPAALRERFSARDGSVHLCRRHELGVDGPCNGGEMTAVTGELAQYAEHGEFCIGSEKSQPENLMGLSPRSLQSLRPLDLGHHAELQRFRNVVGFDVLGSREIGDGSRHFADAVVAACAQSKALHGSREHAKRTRIEPAV
jgi:hypothetical protein